MSARATGWSHHHWLIDLAGHGFEFVAKPGSIHGREEFTFPPGFAELLGAEDKVETLFWQGRFECSERIFFEPEDFRTYMTGKVAEGLERFGRPTES